MTDLQGIGGTRVGEWRCGGDASKPALSFEEKTCDFTKPSCC
jgi:hypothetical protein